MAERNRALTRGRNQRGRKEPMHSLDCANVVRKDIALYIINITESTITAMIAVQLSKCQSCLV